MKKNIKLIALGMAIVFSLCGCGITAETIGETSATKVTQAIEEPTTAVKEEKYEFTPTAEEIEIYNSFFSTDSNISIKIDICDEELARIQNDYEFYDSMGSKSPIYRRADKVTITINDKSYEYEDVGIRMKGNLSRTDFYDIQNNEITDFIHYRLSFNQTFDDPKYYGDEAIEWEKSERKARKNRTFASLEDLEIKWNRNYDNTYVRELYAHELYQAFGILSANMNLSTYDMNGINMGVWHVFEPIDDIFIMRNLPEEDWGGDLYKAGWTHEPANYTSQVTYGVTDKDAGDMYNYSLKTNKKTSDFSSIKKLISVLARGTDEELAQAVDLDYFAMYSATCYFVGNPDDMRNNYNNHYVYFLKSSGKAIFIPYDVDRCLGLSCGYNPSGKAMTNVSPYSEMAVGNQSDQSNPLIRRLIFKSGLAFDKYDEYLSDIVQSEWVSYDKFITYYNNYLEKYEDKVKPSAEFNNVDSSRLDFNLNGVIISDGDKNMSMEDYLRLIVKTYKECQ